jgi:hypothetical protein
VERDGVQFEQITEPFIVTEYHSGQSIDWLPLAVESVVSFSPIINPMVCSQPGSTQRERTVVKIFRIITLHRRKPFLVGMSLAQAVDSCATIEAAARYYLWPIPEVIREVRLLFSTGTSSSAWQTERFTPDFRECPRFSTSISR